MTTNATTNVATNATVAHDVSISNRYQRSTVDWERISGWWHDGLWWRLQLPIELSEAEFANLVVEIQREVCWETSK